jgi:hypothetical protein
MQEGKGEADLSWYRLQTWGRSVPETPALSPGTRPAVFRNRPAARLAL